MHETAVPSLTPVTAIPTFEKVTIIGDKPTLLAEIASLFTRPQRYLPVLDGPRMSRPDWSNEVIRRRNALVMAQSQRVVLADMAIDANEHLSRGWPHGTFFPLNSAYEAIIHLKGWIKTSKGTMPWGSNNLGVGLLLARRSKKILQTTEETSPSTSFVAGSTHLLIACEAGEELAHVTASNLAFATEASFLMFPQLVKDEHDTWLEEIYAIESGGNVSGRFAVIRDRARRWLPDFEFTKYKQILFITNGFPWGIALPECATTHMFSYPDFGRSVVEGIWASNDHSRSARNALLIHPQQVVGSEIESIAKSLHKNGTLVRIQSGPRATVNKVQMLVETLPFDIIVLSTHAGDVPGERATYEYKDSEGLNRRLVVDHAVGFGYDPKTDMVQVQQFERFHELDGVDWSDTAAKDKLYVGTAILSWIKLGDISERNKYKVASERIPRVIGSMGLRMHDHIWIPMLQGLAPNCSPIVLNNACSSWHQLSQRFTFAGARAYVGTLFPVTDAEAQEIGTSLFEKQLAEALPSALWSSQNAVYGAQDRRPYAMIGLPFCSIWPNATDSVAYLAEAYRKTIDEYHRKSSSSPFPDIKENSRRFTEFLHEDFQTFTKQFLT